MDSGENETGLNGYALSRNWFDWCFENPDKIRPSHTALYFFIVEHCNRHGWKSKFGLPTEMAKDAIGIRNYRTYSNTLNDLIEWGFIKLIEKSKNQYSSCIVAIVKNTKAHTKAYTKATQKHIQKQVQSTYKSTVVIDKPINLKPINQEQQTLIFPFDSLKFIEAWKNWNEYRSEIKKPYKSVKSEQAALNALKEFNEEFSISLINRSISNQWQGLIFKDTELEFRKLNQKGVIPNSMAHAIKIGDDYYNKRMAEIAEQERLSGNDQ